ncbi:MAG: metallophosphoesterase [Saprospiraceae bacterium]
MRFIILLLLMFSLDLYLFASLRTLLSPLNQQWRLLLLTAHWAIAILSVGFALYAINYDISHWNKATLTFLRTIIFIIYLSKFLVFPILLIDDARRLGAFIFNKIGVTGTEPFNLNRSKFMTSFGWILGAIPFLSLTYGMIRNPYRYKIRREKLKIKDLPQGLKGLKIVQISDIHSGSFTFKEPVKRAVELINQENADLVFFTGDLVNNKSEEMLGYIDVFDKIKSKKGVFSVLGNHDYGHYNSWSEEDRLKDLDQLKQIHKQLGWDLLLNEHRIIEHQGENIGIIGVENYSVHPRFPKYGDLEKACQNCSEVGVKLLLSHDPSHWLDQVVPSFKDIAVTFSGHTHGMQFGIEIPGWFKWSPVQYVYRQWAGLYQNKEQYLYVNRGLGFLGYAGRVGILPEITVVELT